MSFPFKTACTTARGSLYVPPIPGNGMTKCTCTNLWRQAVVSPRLKADGKHRRSGLPVTWKFAQTPKLLEDLMTSAFLQPLPGKGGVLPVSTRMGFHCKRLLFRPKTVHRHQPQQQQHLQHTTTSSTTATTLRIRTVVDIPTECIKGFRICFTTQLRILWAWLIHQRVGGLIEKGVRDLLTFLILQLNSWPSIKAS